MSKVILKLSKDEALVLFDFLYRFSEKDSLSIEHPAEQRVLWDMSCNLEKYLPEIFDDRYKKLLEKSRRNLSE